MRWLRLEIDSRKSVQILSALDSLSHSFSRSVTEIASALSYKSKPHWGHKPVLTKSGICVQLDEAIELL